MRFRYIPITMTESPSRAATFGQVRHQFIEDLRKQVSLGAKSPNTLWTYDKRLLFFEENMDVELLEDVDRALLLSYLTGLSAGSLRGSRKPASTHYVDNHWRHLNGFLQWCRRRGYRVSSDLFDEGRGGAKVLSVPQPIVDELDPKAWSAEELQGIRSAAKSMGALSMLVVELLLRTGVRLQELANMKVDDVQGEAIKIGRSKSIRGRRTRTVRWVPLYPEPRRMVAVWLDKYRPHSTTEHLLISSRTGRPLTMRGIQSLLDRVHARAGVDQGGPHRYRHTFAIEYLRKNPGQFKRLKDILGHADFRTVEMYAKLAKQDITIDNEDPFA